jgi:flavin reductase (DIM6/NTAB) family NADH-FMN oxidoreductase RutF
MHYRQLLQTIDIVDPATKKATTTLILGTVKCIHVRKDVLNDRGAVDPGKLKPVARMGDTSYSRMTEAYRLPRPLWSALEHEITEAVQALQI